jgi:cell division transport system ATP-binding protein
MTLVKFTNVGLRYSTGPEVLHDVNFTLDAGSFHYLTGPSGAGKTSLLKTLYLAQRPTRGIVHLLGRDVSGVKPADMPALRRQIGIVFQDFRLLPHLSLYDNVALPMRVCGVDEKDISRNVIDLLKWVGLGDRMDSLPLTLSGGEQQRVAIARAVINKPKLLVADEPTGNVDDDIAGKIIYLFEELNRHGTTVVIATHDAALIRRFPHPALCLVDGTIVPSQNLAVPKQKATA